MALIKNDSHENLSLNQKSDEVNQNAEAFQKVVETIIDQNSQNNMCKKIRILSGFSCKISI